MRFAVKRPILHYGGGSHGVLQWSAWKMWNISHYLKVVAIQAFYVLYYNVSNCRQTFIGLPGKLG